MFVVYLNIILISKSQIQTMINPKNTLVYILICITISMSAQDKNIEYGEPFETRGLFKIIGEIDNQLVVQQIHMTIQRQSSSRGSGIGISFQPASTVEEKFYLYNKDLTMDREIITSTFSLRKSIYSEKLIDISIQEGYISKLVLDISGKKKKKPRLRVIPSMADKLKKSEIRIQFKEKTNTSDSGDHFLGNRKHIDVISTYMSEDKSKMVMLVSNEKKTENRIILLDRKLDYNIIEEHILDLVGETDRHKILSLSVSNDGKIGAIVMNYYSNGYGESKKGKPNYDLELIMINKQGNTSHKISSQNYFWLNPAMLIDTQGQVFLSCLLGEKKNSKVAKFYSAKFDEKLGTIYELMTTPKNHSKINSKFGKNYKMSHILPINEDLTISVSTNLKAKNKGELIAHRYTYKGLTLDAVDGKGKYLWSKTIEKNDKQSVVANCIIPDVYYSEKGVEIFMNYSEKTIDQFMVEQPKEVSYPTKNNILTRVTVDTKGNVEMEEISDIDKYSFGSNIHFDNGHYYFMLTDNKFKNAQFAKAHF